MSAPMKSRHIRAVALLAVGFGLVLAPQQAQAQTDIDLTGEWVFNVTSPNGTTQAALEVLMESGELENIMTRAVAAATRRGRELSG